MKKIFNTLNIVYFILIIITVILIIYYVNNFYLVKKEKFTNISTEQCDYIFNNKIVLELCRNEKKEITKSNTYITNNKQSINEKEDVNTIFIKDSKTKKCQLEGLHEDTLTIKCCDGDNKDTCKLNVYSNLINKTVLM